MAGGAPTRRGFLAATGTALLAGCSGLDRFSGDERETVYSHEIQDVTGDGDAEPIVVDDVPVDIERERLSETSDRVSELLGTLPMAFGPSDVPNGHVRQRLVEATERASGYVEDARTAKSRFSALQSLRDARGEARYAAAGWAFVERDLTASAVRAEHDEAVGDAESLQSNYEYLGTDPVDAALVHAPIERNLRRVLDDRPPSIYSRSSPLLTVAAWGEHTEAARARVDDAAYLSDRFTASLPADAGTVEETLSAAAESVATDLRDRRDGLPADPTEDDYELVDRLRYRLRDDAEESAEHVAEADGPASAVLAAHRGLVAFGAYDRFRQRVDDGETFGVTDVTAFREVRSTALESIRTALAESPRPELARPVIADAAMTVAFADEAVGRFSGEVSVMRLDDPVERYTAATLRARSVPEAVRRVVDELDA